MAGRLKDYQWIFTIIVGLFIISAQKVTAGPVRSNVTCMTSVHSNGSASYQLSQPPPYQSCETSWEDDNRFVIANDLEGDPSRVRHLTNQSITLNVCVEQVIHGVECFKMGVSYKTECRANCLAGKNKGRAEGLRSSVSCVPSVHHDGSASYQLSQPPPYQSCDTTWEDDNKIVIAAGYERNQSRVSHLTNQSITLHVCLGHVTYGVECFLEGIVYNTECKVNCSARPTKGPNLICLGTWCTDPWRVVLVFVLPLSLGAIVLVSCLVYRRWVYSSKQRFSVVSHTCDGTENKGSYSAVTTTTGDTAGEDTKPDKAEDRETGF